MLNAANVVSDDDNVKQDISIDVYGRKEKQEKDAAEQVRGGAGGRGAWAGQGRMCDRGGEGGTEEGGGDGGGAA